MKKLSTLSLAMIMLLATSCANQEFTISRNSNKSIPTYEKDQTFFVGGIGQTKETDTAEICGGDHKVAKIANGDSPLNVVIRAAQSVFLYGLSIYTPRETKVTCK